MYQHYTVLLLLNILFAAHAINNGTISCLEYQKEQVGGTMKTTGTKNVQCSNGTNYCVHIYREANDETLEIGQCADDTEPSTTCNSYGCTKEHQEETKTETCCCSTDYCDTPRTSSSQVISTLITFATLAMLN